MGISSPIAAFTFIPCASQNLVTAHRGWLIRRKVCTSPYSANACAVDHALCIRLGRRIQFLFWAEPPTPDGIPHTPHTLPNHRTEMVEDTGRSQDRGYRSARRLECKKDASYHRITPTPSSSHFACLERQGRYAQVGACIISAGKVIDTKLNSRLFGSNQSMEGSCI